MHLFNLLFIFLRTDEETCEVEGAFCKCNTDYVINVAFTGKDVSTINLQRLSEILSTKTFTALFNNANSEVQKT